MSERLTTPEEQKQCLLSNFPDLKDIESAEYSLIGNQILISVPDINADIEMKPVQVIKEEVEIEEKKPHREVYGYNNLIFKTSEGILTKEAYNKQLEESKKYPVVAPVGILIDKKTGKEFIIEPKGILFTEYYLNNKNRFTKEHFIGLLRGFVSQWEKSGKIPVEFDSEDLNKHLLVYEKDGRIELKMTDVTMFRDIGEHEHDHLNKKPEEYLEKMFDKRYKSISDIRHDIRSPITASNGYLGLLLRQGISKEEKQSYVVNLKTTVDKFANQKGLLENYEKAIKSVLPEGQSKEIENYIKYLSSEADELEKCLSGISSVSSDDEIKTAQDKIMHFSNELDTVNEYIRAQNKDS